MNRYRIPLDHDILGSTESFGLPTHTDLLVTTKWWGCNCQPTQLAILSYLGRRTIQPANSRWVSQKTLEWTLTRNRTATLEQGSDCDFLHRHQHWRETKVRFAWRMTVRLLLLHGLPRVKNSHTEAVVIWTVEEICFIHYATLAQTQDDREVCLMDNVQGRRFSIPLRNFSTFYSGISFCGACMIWRIFVIFFDCVI